MWTLNAGLLASMPVTPILTVYGFGGISYSSVKLKGHYSASFMGDTMRESFRETDTDTELAVAAGAIITPMDNLSLGAEVAHIDDTFFSIFGRFTF